MTRDTRNAIVRAARTAVQIGAGAAAQALVSALSSVDDPAVRAIVAGVVAVAAAFGMNLKPDAKRATDSVDTRDER